MDGFFKHSRKLLQQTARDKRLTAADRQILDVAMLYTRSPGLPVGLGIDFLIAESQLARRTVIRARRHLTELGYLILGDNGKRGLSCFVVATGASDDTCTGAMDDTPKNPRGATEDTGTGATGDTGTSVVDGTHIETGDIETTTYAQNDEKPPSSSAPETAYPNPSSESKPKGKSSNQGNQTTSPLPPSSARRPKPAVAIGDAGFVVPDAIRGGWATAYPGVDIDREAAKAFAWCQSNPRRAPKKDFGRFLNGWMSRAKPSDSMTAMEQAADDAELIRGAEDAFPDPDERAAFFWARKERGLRVPPGVDCRPMPVEKEVVA